MIRDFGRYMNTHRYQADGKVRDSDNWQKGIPMDQYMKSLFRHFVDLWDCHRNGGCSPMTRRDLLAAVFFNTQGYWHEFLKHEAEATSNPD